MMSSLPRWTTSDSRMTTSAGGWMAPGTPLGGRRSRVRHGLVFPLCALVMELHAMAMACLGGKLSLSLSSSGRNQLVMMSGDEISTHTATASAATQCAYSKIDGDDHSNRSARLPELLDGPATPAGTYANASRSPLFPGLVSLTSAAASQENDGEKKRRRRTRNRKK